MFIPSFCSSQATFEQRHRERSDRLASKKWEAISFFDGGYYFISFAMAFLSICSTFY